jgi:MoaA/NifB/PqqE/SkfB family radical SAM enzyme
MSDTDREELAETGFDSVRLTFHGTGKMHDDLVSREGAYDDLAETIRRAEQNKVSWLSGMVLNSRNQAVCKKTREAVTALGTPCTELGWMLRQVQWRASGCCVTFWVKAIIHIASS